MIDENRLIWKTDRCTLLGRKFTKSEGVILPQQGTVSCAPRIRMLEYLLLVLLSAGNQHWNSEVDEYTKTKIKNNYVWLQNLHLLYVTIQFIRSIYQYKALAKRYSQLKPTRAKFTTSMELGIIWSPTWLEPSCFVIVRWLGGRSQTIEWFSCERARLGGTVWPLNRCKFGFCNLARVDLSWEYRLARA